jgi:hypothetical protein
MEVIPVSSACLLKIKQENGARRAWGDYILLKAQKALSLKR